MPDSLTKRKVLLSFSGGETSGFLTRQMLATMADKWEMVTVFANTGKEREETLEFVRECDRHFGFNTVWIEAIEQDPRPRTPCKFKVISFETASRNGEPFEHIIRKYGIPNKSTPHCTRELKRRPIRAYAKSIGWRVYWTAIGIRIDEVDRISAEFREQRLFYPLIKLIPTAKPAILDWWSQQPFRLQLKGHEGNCDLCWKKTLRKLLTLAKDDPSRLDWWRQMEERHGTFATPAQRSMRRMIADGGRRTFFREHRSSDDILAMSKKPFEPWSEDRPTEFQTELDLGGGCSESCEVF